VFPEIGHLTLSFLLSFQFVEFRRNDDVLSAVAPQPVAKFEILFHPAPPRIQQQKTELQSLPAGQILFDQEFPGVRDLLGNPRISIPGQINETPPIFDPEEIDVLRPARR